MAHFLVLCRRCILRNRPQMLTGYCLPDARCDLCLAVRDCAVTQAP